MDPEVCAKVTSLGAKLVTLTLGPEAKVEDHVDTEHDTSRRRFPQQRLDRGVPLIVPRETFIVAVVVNVVADMSTMSTAVTPTDRPMPEIREMTEMNACFLRAIR